MKKSLVIFLLFPCLTNAQLVRGILLDNSNSEPIAFASIGIFGFTSATISNENGEFSFETNGSDSIMVSHLNYGLNNFKMDINKAKQMFRLNPVDSFTR